MRLLHLAPASRERGIRRAGLKGTKVTLLAPAGAAVELPHAVFAMPVVFDFWTTFQWLRELRRWHGERLIAVYFRLPDGEAVHAGRYGEPHAVMTASAAAAWVSKNPAGAEVVIPHGVAAGNVLGIKQVPQLVGWTGVPEESKKLGCVCPACLPRGDRAFMRRVRGAYHAGISAVRGARSAQDLRSAMSSLAIPLERARGRIEPDKILPFARSEDPKVRRTVANLLGWFDWSQVQRALEPLLRDDDAAVRRECVESMVRAAGTRRAAGLIEDAPDDAAAHFVECLEFQAGDAATLGALERFARHPAPAVREAASRVAEALASK